MAAKEKLNKIESQLKFKCIQELNNTVEAFMYEIEKLDKKYGGAGFFNIIEDNKYLLIDLRENQFRNLLVDCLKDRHLEKMVAHKCKQLIKKIEVLDE